MPRYSGDKRVVEVIHGRRHVFEIVQTPRLIGHDQFDIFRDGAWHRGAFPSLARAVQAAREEG